MVRRDDQVVAEQLSIGRHHPPPDRRVQLIGAAPQLWPADGGQATVTLPKHGHGQPPITHDRTDEQRQRSIVAPAQVRAATLDRGIEAGDVAERCQGERVGMA
jgi:hypothetical protein